MKIVHVSMLGYLDNWGYQDNLLPEYMALAEHDVTMITSSNFFPPFVKIEEKKAILDKGKIYRIGHVKIRRIKVHITTSQYPFLTCGLYKSLNEETPEVIFHHGVNSSSMMICWWYCVKHPNVKLFVDSHADWINQSPHKLWNSIVIKGLMGLCTKVVQSKVTRFYGVTPGRCDYLIKVFGADRGKVVLYPIGGDTNTTDSITLTKSELKKKYNIQEEAFVFVSGGKMGVDKGTDALIEAFAHLRKDNLNLALVLFGRFVDNETKILAENTDGVYINGWCDRTKTLELLKMSDIACWPIHHTTLIEDAIASSVPLIIRKTSNTSHSIDGNGEFVENGTKEELMKASKIILSNYNSYAKSARVMHDKYSYINLVKQFEDDCL